MWCRSSPVAMLLLGCGVGILVGVLLQSTIAAVLLGLICMAAGCLLLRR